MVITKRHKIFVLSALITVSGAYHKPHNNPKHVHAEQPQLVATVPVHLKNNSGHHGAIFSINTASRKIIGGSNAIRNQFPFTVPVHFNNRYWCGGTIASPTWVISAAHCYDTPNRQRNLKVFAGMLWLGEHHPDVQVRDVGEVLLHHKYQFNDAAQILINDIALLRLSDPLRFNNAVKPIVLPRPHQTFSGVAKLLGWGNTHARISPILEFITAPLITLKECKQLCHRKPSHYKLYPSMICTLPYLGQQVCSGDSGGSLVQDGVLVGVVSWGDEFCGTQDDQRIPDVFTKVSHFIHFIEKHIKNISRNY